MQDKNHMDDWLSLCEQASQECDPQKLLELITKINRALERCQQPRRTDEASLKINTVLPPISMMREHDSDLYRFPGECTAIVEYDC